jgi:hypothetical protein
MELATFLASDAALVVLSALGLVATGLAIVRDIPAQQRVAERPRGAESYGPSAYLTQGGRGS